MGLDRCLACVTRDRPCTGCWDAAAAAAVRPAPVVADAGAPSSLSEALHRSVDRLEAEIRRLHCLLDQLELPDADPA
jgi:hypothetical protein